MTGCIVITGASGFVGSALVSRLKKNVASQLSFTSVRQGVKIGGKQAFKLDHLSSTLDFERVVSGADTVVHLGSIAHRKDHKGQLFENSLFHDNVVFTRKLIKASVSKNVRQFIFLSSTGVHGEQVTRKRSYKVDDMPAPHDNYTLSKYLCEIELFNSSKSSSTTVTILRAPLVYGPGAQGTFGLLMKLNSLGIPLPIASVNNSRRFISIENLTDVIIRLLTQPQSESKIFLVGDENTMSTLQLYEKAAFYNSKPKVVFPFNVEILRFVLKFMKLGKTADVLLGDFDFDTGMALRLGELKICFGKK